MTNRGIPKVAFHALDRMTDRLPDVLPHVFERTFLALLGNRFVYIQQSVLVQWLLREGT